MARPVRTSGWRTGATVVVAASLLAACAGRGGSAGSAQTMTSPTQRLREALEAGALTALGDSVPAGSACNCTPYPQLTATDLSRVAGRTIPTSNDAVGGYTSADVVHQLDDDHDVIDDVRHSGVVLVEVGANDVEYSTTCGTTLSCYTPNLPDIGTNLRRIDTRIHQLAPKRHVDVVFLDYWNVWLGGRYAAAQGPDYIETSDVLTNDVDDLIRSEAHASNSLYVDLQTAFKGPDRSWDETHLLAPDGDHPNADGHRRIADATELALVDEAEDRLDLDAPVPR